MTNPDDPAFVGEVHRDTLQLVSGLTKREYFAAMAITAVTGWHAGLHDDSVKPEVIAIEALMLADALIAELNKKHKAEENDE